MHNLRNCNKQDKKRVHELVSIFISTAFSYKKLRIEQLIFLFVRRNQIFEILYKLFISQNKFLNFFLEDWIPKNKFPKTSAFWADHAQIYVLKCLFMCTVFMKTLVNNESADESVDASNNPLWIIVLFLSLSFKASLFSKVTLTEINARNIWQ